MTALTDRIAAVLNLHYGGWIDNGNTEKCHCVCGYRPTWGESHSRHVAEQMAELFTEETESLHFVRRHRWVSAWKEVEP